ncbi:MAG: arsenate reductase family protein [Bacteroidia bacterium]|nr:arsenate reductase family protein [Bacteroidia bacterium]NNM23446.1 arsenate reductase family protein [Flavobacteriaceae bacterium]
MIVVYHNPDCSKSNACLNFMETSKHDFKLVKYMDEPLTEKKLRKILELLDFEPLELVRTNELIWQQKYATKNLSDTEIIHAMLTYPDLMQRPIVINGDKAVIGRPPERVLDIL